jgi:putative transposase
MGLRNRKIFLEEKCFFVTTSCYKHLKLLETESCKLLIANSLNFVAAKYKISILGYVTCLITFMFYSISTMKTNCLMLCVI